MNETETSQLPSLSVVVPLYNDEAYIGENLRSVLENADGIRLEIIVVNDGSTDGSLIAAEEVRDATSVPIRIYTTENRGLSAARNYGLEQSRSKYVAFLDSDDFVSPHTYKTQLDLAERDDCVQVFSRSRIHDMTSGERREFYDFDVWENIVGSQQDRSFSPKDVPEVFLVEPKICARVWRRDYLVGNNLSFPEGRIHEDIGLHLKSFALNGRVGIVNAPGLIYRHGHGGRITEQKNRARFDVLKNAEDTLRDPVIKGLQPEIAGYPLASLMRVVFWCRMGMPKDLKQEFDRLIAPLLSLVDFQMLKFAHQTNRRVVRRFVTTALRHGSWSQRAQAFVYLVRLMIAR